MRSRYKITELESPHFITCTLGGWRPVFTGARDLDILTASPTFCRPPKGLCLQAQVILDHHFPLLVCSD